MPHKIARVALDVPLPRLFDYLGDELSESDIGRRIRVPFGRKEVVGLLLDIADTSELPAEKLRSVIEADRQLSPLAADVLALIRFCASYYHYPVGQIALAALPTALRRWHFQLPRPRQYFALTAQGRQALPHSLPPRAVARQRLASRLLAGAADSAELAALCNGAAAVLQNWLGRGWLETVREGINAPAPVLPQLLPGQQAVCSRIAEHPHEFAPFLLHGITGSGKTEVYLRLVEEALASGRQALILVPEIGLTPQFTQRVSARFPDTGISVLHSGLAEGERLQRWQSAASGKARIVLGTRLAVFTPLPELGLIIVDEEHDASFSQQEGLRYSARDLAVFRARQRRVPVVLGSATPSLESWQNTLDGRYALLTLPVRATGARLPELRLIDTRIDKPEDGLSRPALKAIGETLARGEQALIFINRRGYAPVLHCPACAWVAPCPRCSARLTLHLREQRLRCHHCGHEERIPADCPACGNPDIRALGQGTQRVEEALARHFPDARSVRADRDATRRKGSWETMQAEIHAGTANLIIGTQLIAKGHDFPELTLVVVLDADGALFSLDFRAEERLFAQLLQVAGRAGRADKPGQVLIQTGFPQHPLFSHLLAHDFPGFADEQLAIRRKGLLPPFSRQAVLRAEAARLADALAWLQAARALAPEMPGVEMFEPVSAPMLKKAGHERAQLWLQSVSRTDLQLLLREWVPKLRDLPARNVRWHLDVDPAEN